MHDRGVILANKLRFSIKPEQETLYLISSQLININLRVSLKMCFSCFYYENGNNNLLKNVK